MWVLKNIITGDTIGYPGNSSAYPKNLTDTVLSNFTTVLKNSLRNSDVDVKIADLRIKEYVEEVKSKYKDVRAIYHPSHKSEAAREVDILPIMLQEMRHTLIETLPIAYEISRIALKNLYLRFASALSDKVVIMVNREKYLEYKAKGLELTDAKLYSSLIRDDVYILSQDQNNYLNFIEENHSNFNRIDLAEIHEKFVYWGLWS